MMQQPFCTRIWASISLLEPSLELLATQLHNHHNLQNWKEALTLSEVIFDRTDELFRLEVFEDLPLRLRQSYEIAAILWVMSRLKASQKDRDPISKEIIVECLGKLDLALLMTGCPLFAIQVHELLSDLQNQLPKDPLIETPSNIFQFQRSDLDEPLLNPIKVSGPIALSTFLELMSEQQPLVLRGLINHWPALSKRPWRNLNYFNNLAGARTVPVEIGSKYTDTDWSQKLVPFKFFLDHLIHRDKESETMYLAQFNLLNHIPQLQADICVPDYCYLTEKEPQVHVWFGPRGTVSPCHHDPYENLFAQVCGYKLVRLYHPKENLYPFGEGSLMTNTSAVRFPFDF